MTTEQLPEGLDIAVEMIGEYVESVVVCHRHPATGELAPQAEIDRRHGAAAIEAIRAEHQQRVKAERTLIAAGYTDNGGELWKPPIGPSASPLLERIAELEAENAKFRQWLEESNERAEDYAGRVLKLDAAAGKEPVAWLQYARKKPSARALAFEPGLSKVAVSNGFVETPLYASPVPAQDAPEGWRLVPKKLTKEMRSEFVRAAREYMQEYGGNSPEVMYEAAISASPEATR